MKQLTHFVDDLGYSYMVDISKIQAITDVFQTYMKDGRDKNLCQISVGPTWFTAHIDAKELCDLLKIELDEIL